MSQGAFSQYPRLSEIPAEAHMGRVGSDSQVAEVNAVIAKLPPDSQRRIEAIAATLRAMLGPGKRHEVELAITLVLAELSAAALEAAVPPSAGRGRLSGATPRRHRTRAGN
jgi:hypothetical protein